MTRYGFFVFVFLVLTAGVGRAEELPLDNAALAAATGGSEASVTSVISENKIGDVGFTGGISNVSASGNSGLTTLIENTGNQVSIATSTTINVNFH
jgi:hypothetical protein